MCYLYALKQIAIEEAGSNPFDIDTYGIPDFVKNVRPVLPHVLLTMMILPMMVLQLSLNPMRSICLK